MVDKYTLAITRLSHHFAQNTDVRAVILTGSLADDSVPADLWSDVDLKVIVADSAMETYTASTGWLALFGQVLGLEKHISPSTQTLRVCLDGFRRFDFVFIAESALQDDVYLLQRPCWVLWSRLPDLEARIVPQRAPEYHGISDADVGQLADTFWFKVSVAIAKVARNDLLIGAHLALDLARDCLVLQMLRRDREKGTTIHHTGGWGNDLVAQLVIDAQQPSAHRILDLIRWSCATFDALAAELSPTYTPRAQHFLSYLQSERIRLCSSSA